MQEELFMPPKHTAVRLQGCTGQPRLRPRESGVTLFQVNMQSNKTEIHD
jgi:hypothetical protein